MKMLGFIPWFFRGLAILAKAAPGKIALIIVAMAFARAASVLALLLPLKVVILAGSEGIPRYFQFFIGPDEKTQWIIYLALSSIALYLIKIALDSFSESVLQDVSMRAVDNATKLNVLNNQEDKAKSYLAQFCRVSSYSLFFLSGLAIILFIQPSLFVFIVVALSSFLMLTLLILSGGDDISPGKLKAYVQRRFRNYVNTISSILFLLSFLAILTPLLVGEVERNLIFSLLSLLLVRQMLTVGSSGMVAAVALSKNKDQIDGLLHPKKVYKKKEKKISVAFRDMFSRPERDVLINEKLGNGGGSYHSRWEDFYILGCFRFSIANFDNSNDPPLLLNVFMPYRKHYLENEEFLFEHVGRNEVMAASLVARFPYKAFECQVVESGDAVESPAAFKAAEKKILEKLWCVIPGDSLVSAYRSSHSLLHDRINPELLDKVRVAINSDSEEENYKWMTENLPSIKSSVASLPLCIHNPDINRTTVVAKGEPASYLVTTWVRWRIDPLGAYVPSDYSDDDISALVEQVSSVRGDTQSCDVEKVKLCWHCWRLDKNIKAGKYEKAMADIKNIKKMFEAVS